MTNFTIKLVSLAEIETVKEALRYYQAYLPDTTTDTLSEEEYREKAGHAEDILRRELQ